jgi:hypothetical protein
MKTFILNVCIILATVVVIFTCITTIKILIRLDYNLQKTNSNLLEVSEGLIDTNRKLQYVSKGFLVTNKNLQDTNAGLLNVNSGLTITNAEIGEINKQLSLDLKNFPKRFKNINDNLQKTTDKINDSWFISW